MKGVLVRNGYYSSLSTRYQTVRLTSVAETMGFPLVVYDNKEPYSGGKLPPVFSDADVVFFFDKDLKLAYALENAGKTLLNPARAIEIADDKALTAVFLDAAGIPTPTTVPSPVRYDGGIDEEYLKKVGERLGYPLVVKENKGSLGTQVYLAESYEKLLETDRALSRTERLYQKYEVGSKGESYRAIVIGHEVFCAIRLKNDTDFRSNAAKGGVAEAVELPAEYADLAVRAAEKLGLRYCGVDLFCDKPSVIEVNSNAYFLSAEKATKKDVAGAVIEQAISLVSGK